MKFHAHFSVEVLYVLWFCKFVDWMLTVMLVSMGCLFYALNEGFPCWRQQLQVRFDSSFEVIATLISSNSAPNCFFCSLASLNWDLVEKKYAET
jgi:hypothetical protein